MTRHNKMFGNIDFNDRKQYDVCYIFFTFGV